MPSSRPQPAPARFNRFRVVRELGVGAQGTVHEVVDVERGARLALKTLRSIGPDEIVRLKTEFRAVRDLRHDNLVRLGELVEEDRRWFFTMELVEGTDFIAYVRGEEALDDSTSWPTRIESGPRARVASETRAEAEEAPSRRTRGVASFDEEKLRRGLAQLAGALAFLHGHGKIHRDVKPSNVLVDRSGRVVLIDFGVVAEFAAANADEGAMVGTAPYMAPEQVLGASLGFAADWYAVGVLLFEALTGRRPFEGDAAEVMERKCLVDPPAPSALVEGLPADLESLCTAMLAREPDERPTDEGVLRALGVEDALDAAPRSLFFGRGNELGALRAALSDVRTGGQGSVFLEGESGVGKSALARRFVEEVRSADPKAVALEGRCHEQERVPYNAFDAMLDGLARFLRSCRDTTRASLLPPSFERVRDVFPSLGARDAPAGTDAKRRDARVEREEAFATLRELLRRLGERRTLIVAVEDIQWADADSLALLRALTEPPDAPRMLLVATARLRPDGSSCAAAESVRGPLQRIPVTGLSEKDARTLVDHLLGERGAPDEDADAILESSRGHPMFIEELVRYLARPDAGGGAATLDDAVRARVHDLDATSRQVLRVVATAGQPTPQAAIAEAAGVSFAAYAEGAAVLRAGRLVRTHGSRIDDAVEPYHDRVREAVYARIDRGARVAYHAALGAALERRASNPELLHWHFDAAGDRARAIRYAEIAAAAAARSLAFDRAGALYRYALARAPGDAEHRRALLVSLGHVLVDGGRSKEAAEAFLEASRTGAPPEGTRLELVRRTAEQFLVSGHLEPGLDALQRVLRAFGLSLPDSRLAAFTRLGWAQARLAVHPLTWTPRKAEEVDGLAAARIDLCWSVSGGLALVDTLRSILFVDIGVLFALKGGDDGRLARALSAAAVGEAGLGRRGPAKRLGDACRRAAQGAGTDRARFYGELANLTYRFFLENDWRGCIEGTREAVRLLQADGRRSHWESDVVDQFACWSLDNLGLIDELRVRVPAKIRAAERAGNRLIEVNFRTQFVVLRLADDQPAEAQREVREAIAAWPRREEEFGNQDYLALRSFTQTAFYAGDVGELARLMKQWKRYFGSLISRVVFLRQDALYWTGAWAIAEARATKVGGERRRLVRSVRQAVKELEGFGLPMASASALHLRAALAACQGEEAGARALLETALAHADRLGTVLNAACIRWRLGSFAGDGAADHRARAEAWMRAQSVRAPEKLVRAVLPGWSDAY